MNLVVDLANSAEVADAIAILESVRDGGWPGESAGKPKSDEKAPWEDDEKPARSSQRAAKDDDEDPWASSSSSRSKSSSSRSSRSSASTEAGKDFPAEGEYERQAKSGLQVWTFGTRKAPECDCGHPAAQVEGYKGKDSARGKPSWTAFWCPVGFGKNWKNKCDFSEFA